MKQQKIKKILTDAKTAELWNDGGKMWLGDGCAMYALDGLPEFGMAVVPVLYDINVEKFAEYMQTEHENPAPEDNYRSLVYAQVGAEIGEITINGVSYTPVLCKGAGIRFVKTRYLVPLEEETTYEIGFIPTRRRNSANTTRRKMKMMILPIKSEWFNMIVSGDKKEEYREIKPYWTARFQNYFESGKPRTVRLRAGYDAVKNRGADVLCTLSVGTGRPEWGAIPGKKYYVLRIERVVKVYAPAKHLSGYHTVYLAGKISGDPNYVQKFADAEKLLKDMGYNVYNPAVAPEGMSREWYMRESFRMINRADAVFFLPDWEDSEGAKLEYAYAKYIEKPIRRIIAMG